VQIIQKKIVFTKLTAENKHQSMAFSEWAQNNEVSFNNVWFSDEKHFHFDRAVNKKNKLFSKSQNPHVIYEKVHHVPKLQCGSPSQVMDC
jgi:cytidylate kinase